MELYVNRYYKSNKKGYCFSYNEEIFSSGKLRREIQRKIIGGVIGNESIVAWVGGSVENERGKKFFIFGHNQMLAQEKGMDRLSCYFTFVAVSSDMLYRMVPIRCVMERIHVLEDKKTITENKVEIPDATLTRMPNIKLDRLIEAMALATVDTTTSFTMDANEMECQSAIDALLERSLFAEQIPVFCYLDQKSSHNPKNQWQFRVSRTLASQIVKNNLRVSGMSEGKKYLYFAYKTLCLGDYKRFQQFFMPQKREELETSIGTANRNLELPLLIWYYAMKNDPQLLPTQSEKEAILAEIR